MNTCNDTITSAELPALRAFMSSFAVSDVSGDNLRIASRGVIAAIDQAQDGHEADHSLLESRLADFVSACDEETRRCERIVALCRQIEAMKEADRLREALIELIPLLPHHNLFGAAIAILTGLVEDGARAMEHAVPVAQIASRQMH
jgi:hypothetical protein